MKAVPGGGAGVEGTAEQAPALYRVPLFWAKEGFRRTCDPRPLREELGHPDREPPPSPESASGNGGGGGGGGGLGAERGSTRPLLPDVAPGPAAEARPPGPRVPTGCSRSLEPNAALPQRTSLSRRHP